jgi:hypothetical protein
MNELQKIGFLRIEPSTFRRVRPDGQVVIVEGPQRSHWWYADIYDLPGFDGVYDESKHTGQSPEFRTPEELAEWLKSNS